MAARDIDAIRLTHEWTVSKFIIRRVAPGSDLIRSRGNLSQTLVKSL